METIPVTVSGLGMFTGTPALVVGGLATLAVGAGVLLTTWLGSTNKDVSEPSSPEKIVISEFSKDLQPVSSAELLEWDEQADNGDTNAQFKLGECYYHGNGVPANYVIAVRRFRQAAEADNVMSLYYLGRCYELGHGVTVNLSVAKNYYNRAAKQGSREAQTALRRLSGDI